MNYKEYTSRIIQSIKRNEENLLIQSINIGEIGWRNELVLFAKPEIFMVNDDHSISNSIELIFKKLVEFDVETCGITIVGGRVLDSKEVMNNHYGFINRLSRLASRVIDSEDKLKIAIKLGLSEVESTDYQVLGGHEYLIKYPNENFVSLDKLWFSKKSLKLRSGFYVQAYETQSDKIILVNGFHPAQLDHFTNPSHKIILFLLRSNTDWSVLKNQMVGATFPEKAVQESIRGSLFAKPSKYGLEEVSIANNGVHLSAGPFEAVFEIHNFYGNIYGFDLEKNKPLALKRMIEVGIPYNQSIVVIRNPIFKIPEKEIDLYSATEDLNTDEGVEFWKKNSNQIIGYTRE